MWLWLNTAGFSPTGRFFNGAFSLRFFPHNCQDLVIFNLWESPVKLAYGGKIRRGAQANRVIGVL